MSITTECRECRQVFKKRSLKSTEKICDACRGSGGRNRYKVMANKTVNAIKVGELKNIIISSMTKAQKAQEEVKELTKLVKKHKASNTRMNNKIKAFEKRLGI